MKIFKLLSISLSLVTILASCNLPSRTQTAVQNLAGTKVAMTMQTHLTQTKIIATTPLANMTATASPIPTLIPPNTPVWSTYSYSCRLATGGGTMTMNLGWSDRSDSEESYKVYRNGQIIATLEPNSAAYVDVTFVATGKTLSYSVEAFNEDWQASTPTITNGCE